MSKIAPVKTAAKNKQVQKTEIKAVDNSPSSLISQAIKAGADIEVMERLFALSERDQANKAKVLFFEDLSRLQSELPEIVKTKIVNDKYGKERYRYAPLDSIVKQVKAVLHKNGFSYRTETRQTQGDVTAVCVVTHIAGHCEKTEFTIPIESNSFMNKAQHTASALTYAKRYSFCDAFGIMTADDDDDAQVIPVQNEAKKSAPVQQKQREVPNACKALNTEIMSLVGSTNNKKPYFTPTEQASVLNSARVAIADLEALKKVYNAVKIKYEERTKNE